MRGWLGNKGTNVVYTVRWEVQVEVYNQGERGTMHLCHRI